MKKYKPYTAKKLKFPRRLLFFLIVALIIFIIAVIAGNGLKSKVEKIKSESDGTTYSLETEKSSMETMAVTAEHDSALASVSAGNFDPAGVTDEYSVRERVSALIAEGYNAVSYNVFSEDGSLTYASPAMEALTRLPASEKLLPYSLLGTTVACVKGSHMRMCAVLLCSDNTDSDCAVAGELYSLGFEEILVTGFESSVPDDETVSRIGSYLDAMKKSAPVDFGVLLSDVVLSDSKNAPFVEKIYAKANFLAIDMRDYTAQSAALLADKLQGSFSAYLLRPLLDGSSAENAKSIKSALNDSGIKACQFCSSAPQSAAVTSGVSEDENAGDYYDEDYDEDYEED